MDPVLALVLEKNSADIEAIVAKVGVGTLLSLTPHILNILATIQSVKAKA